MSMLAQAVCFAAQMHDGTTRKGSELPYIVHPMEVAAIVGTLTEDEEVLAAAVLHDVMEDCGVAFDELERRFGLRVAQLVEAESHTHHEDMRASWEARKRESLEKLWRGDRNVKIIALGDKLSNMRAICRDYERDGDAIFFRFNQHDKRRHAWYYRRCTALLRGELGDTPAWAELQRLVERVFAGVADGEAQCVG